MKNIIIILLVSLLNLNSFSQCKFIKNEVDEFTNKEMKQTGGKLIREFTGSNANIIFDKQGENFFITINYNVQYAKAMVVGTKDITFIKLKNDSVIKITPQEIASGELITISNITTSRILIVYRVEKTTLEYLLTQDILKLRISFTDGYKEHDVKSKFNKNIKKSISCILK
tara:strand:+ start:44 stop:556 length:513 start_codon:yes stop_codon:yes gene_type:complete